MTPRTVKLSVVNKQTSDVFIDWICIRLRLLMKAANKTMDANTMHFMEIESSKELLIKYGHAEFVRSLVKEFEAPWRRSHAR